MLKPQAPTHTSSAQSTHWFSASSLWYTQDTSGSFDRSPTKPNVFMRFLHWSTCLPVTSCSRSSTLKLLRRRMQPGFTCQKGQCGRVAEECAGLSAAVGLLLLEINRMFAVLTWWMTRQSGLLPAVIASCCVAKGGFCSWAFSVHAIPAAAAHSPLAV